MEREPWQSEDWMEPQWTERQAEVLRFIARGRTNAEIAAELEISLSGAKWHVTEILSKLGVSSRDDAAAYWRWHVSRRRKLRDAAHGMVTAGALRLAVGIAAVAVAGAAIAGGLALLLPGSNGAPAEDEASGWNDDGAMVFSFDPRPFGPGTLTLDRLVQVEDGIAACVVLDGFTVDQSLVLRGAIPVIVNARGEQVAAYRVPGPFGGDYSVQAPGACPEEPSDRARVARSVLFPPVGELATGGRFEMPFSGSWDLGTGRDHEIDALATYVGEVTAFEWGTPPSLVAVQHRINPLAPVNTGTDSPYAGRTNHLVLASVPLSGDRTAELWLYHQRGQFCAEPKIGGASQIICTLPTGVTVLDARVSGGGPPALLVLRLEPTAETATALLADGGTVPLDVLVPPADLDVALWFVFADVRELDLVAIEVHDTDSDLVWLAMTSTRRGADSAHASPQRSGAGAADKQGVDAGTRSS